MDKIKIEKVDTKISNSFQITHEGNMFPSLYVDVVNDKVTSIESYGCKKYFWRVNGTINNKNIIIEGADIRCVSFTPSGIKQLHALLGQLLETFGDKIEETDINEKREV